MPARFSESFLSELSERNRIEDVVGEYVELSKRSGANLFGLCPFHNEKTPSFSVSPGKQIYYCFGCGKGGGVVNFIMDVEHLNFPEAVAHLAKRVGMQIPEEDDPEAIQRRKRRERLYALNRDAARFFYEQIGTPGGKIARDYMQKRKILPATAKNFGLGFAPDSWDSLRNAMRAKGYSDEELAAADLIKSGRNGSFYDTFRNRLMFPVIDIRGNVLGFSGRMLGDNEPKYLNSRDTPVFIKGQNLFAMNLAKASKSGYILLVEGNVDVVSLHQAGFDSAVASLGTSLTDEQAQLLSRFTKQVIISYDSDSAGTKASRRAIGILEKLDVKVRVLRIPGAKDPDDYIKEKGPAAFRNLIDGAESQLEYLMANIRAKYDLSESDQKTEYAREAVNLIASLPDPITREIYADKISKIAGIDLRVIRDSIDRTHRGNIRKAQKAENSGVIRTVGSSLTGEKNGGIRFENDASAIAEQGVIRLIAADPSLAVPVPIEPEEFTSPELRHIYSVLLNQLRNHDSTDIPVLSSMLSQEEMRLYIFLQNAPEKISSGASAMRDYVGKIRSIAKENEPVTDPNAVRDELIRKGKGYR